MLELSIFILFLLVVSAIAHKYHIDTSSTITELRSERDKYRKLLWVEIEGKKKFIEKHSNPAIEKNNAYKIIKDKIDLLTKDIESDDRISKDIRVDLIDALHDIDNYGEVKSD